MHGKLGSERPEEAEVMINGSRDIICGKQDDRDDPMPGRTNDLGGKGDGGDDNVASSSTAELHGREADAGGDGADVSLRKVPDEPTADLDGEADSDEARNGSRVVGRVDDLVDGAADDGNGGAGAPADPFRGKWVDGRDIMARMTGVGGDGLPVHGAAAEHESEDKEDDLQGDGSGDGGNGEPGNARDDAEHGADTHRPTEHMGVSASGYDGSDRQGSDGGDARGRTADIHPPLPAIPCSRRRTSPVPHAHGSVSGRHPLQTTLLVAAGVAIAVAAVVNPPIYSVTVNGTSRLVLSGTTVRGMAESIAPGPRPGRLLAVDGSVIDGSGGDAFEARTDGGDALDDGSRLMPGESVTISDGDDVTEPYDKEVERIPHGDADPAKVDSASHYYDGSVHVYRLGTDGERETRTGKVSGKVATVTTREPVASSYDVLSPDTHGEKVIALTFDDGPNPTYTPQVLDVLRENDAKATFMEVGSLVSEDGDLVKRVRDEGHEIGTHTWDHAAGSGHGVDITRMTADEQRTEVDRGFQAIKEALGESVPKVMRAPGGNYHGDAIRNLAGHADVEVGWDVDTRDWSRPGSGTIAARLMAAKPGDIVLMHDGGGNREQTVEALRQALPQLKAEGYRFVTVSEMLSRYCGIDVVGNR